MRTICSNCGNEFSVSIRETMSSYCPACETAKWEENSMFIPFEEESAGGKRYSNYEDNIDDQEIDYFEAIDPEDIY